MELTRLTAFSSDVGTLDYVALLVEELDGALGLYRSAFLAKVSPREEYARYGFSAAYVDLGYARLKLMQAYDRARPVVGLVDAQARLGLHHVSYKVTGIAAVRERMIGEGFRPFGPNGVVSGPGGRMSFLRPSDNRLPLIRLFEPDQVLP